MNETLFKLLLGGAFVAGGVYLVKRESSPSPSLPTFDSRAGLPYYEAERPYRPLCTGGKRSWCDWSSLPSARDVMAESRDVYCPENMHWKARYTFEDGKDVSVICHGDAGFSGNKNVYELMLDTGRIIYAYGHGDLERKLTQYGHSMLDVEYDERAQEAMDLLRSDDDTES